MPYIESELRWVIVGAHERPTARQNLPDDISAIVVEGTTRSGMIRHSSLTNKLRDRYGDNPNIQMEDPIDVVSERSLPAVMGEPLVNADSIITPLREAEGELLIKATKDLGLNTSDIDRISKKTGELSLGGADFTLLTQVFNQMMRINPENVTQLRSLIIAQTAYSFEQTILDQTKTRGKLVFIVGTMHFGLLEALLMPEEERLWLIRENPNTLKLYNPATINQGYYVKSNRSGTSRIGVQFPNPIIPERVSSKRKKK